MEIQHFSHNHPLVFEEERSHDSDEKAYCNVCGEVVSGPTYSCVACGFHLDKNCAEAPLELNHPFHRNHSLTLGSETPVKFWFNCDFCNKRGCKSLHSGFAYNWKAICLCVQCAEFSLSYASQAHKEHLLLYYKKYNGQCNACGNSIDNAAAYRCKSCNFNVHWACTLLPQTARHKCDEHSLKLTYHEVNDYSESHSCDICEKRRNPNIWFYHCALCDKSAHPKCVLGDYSFIKLGRRISAKTDHPHSLILVQKVYLYPECSKCGQFCLDLALECTDTRCSFIIHWRCSRLKDFIEDHNIVELIAVKCY